MDVYGQDEDGMRTLRTGDTVLSGCTQGGLFSRRSCARSRASGCRRDPYQCAPSYVRLRPPPFRVQQLHVNPTSLHTQLFLYFTSQHSSGHHLSFSINNSPGYLRHSEHSCPSTDESCQPVMYHPNSHQTDICLELLLTSRVTFR